MITYKRICFWVCISRMVCQSILFVHTKSLDPPRVAKVEAWPVSIAPVVKEASSLVTCPLVAMEIVALPLTLIPVPPAVVVTLTGLCNHGNKDYNQTLSAHVLKPSEHSFAYTLCTNLLGLWDSYQDSMQNPTQTSRT